MRADSEWDITDSVFVPVKEDIVQQHTPLMPRVCPFCGHIPQRRRYDNVSSDGSEVRRYDEHGKVFEIYCDCGCSLTLKSEWLYDLTLYERSTDDPNYDGDIMDSDLWETMTKRWNERYTPKSSFVMLH